MAFARRPQALHFSRDGPAAYEVGLGVLPSRTLLFGAWLMSNRLRVFHHTIGCFGVIWPPQMKDNAISLGSRFCGLFGILRRLVQHLHSPGGDLHRMVVIELVPRRKGHVRTGYALGHKVLHLL